jgi:predicted nucleic acid-binding protein
MAYLFDTNTFLRLADNASPMREAVLAAIRKLRQNSERICYSPQILAEFWNVSTRPHSARGGLEIPVSRTVRNAHLINKYFELLPDSLATFNEWRRLVINLEISGVQVHDAKIASTMLVHGIPNLVTFNTSDFKRFPVIQAIEPSDI